ncbi:MAG: hypothetical protein IKO75_09170 [Bacteroidales bacterium]|nr:hypothetical protein [Bacteroidales bacterium]
MKNSQIKENLFSFKTFRSPDRIGEIEKNLLFARHPNMEKSVFNQCPMKRDGDGDTDYEIFMKQLEPIASYKELRSLYPEFYEFSCRLMQQRKNDSSRPKWEDNYPQPLDDDLYFALWEELLKQIATRKSMAARQACVQMIIAQHFLSKKMTPENVSNLTVVIPERVAVFVATWQHGLEGEGLYGVYNLGIQDFRRVEQTLCCYVPGEVSHIENVMAREFKEKSSRNTLRTEQTTELSSESTIENTNDTTTAERNEVSSEIAKILQKDKAFDVSGSVTVSKDSKIFGSISSNVSTGYNSSNSSSLSNTEAKNYAKEVTERAIERIEQKTAEKRTYKIIKEFEEIDKHGFDNRLGKEHVTGVYRWVDKIYKNELVNYGKRLVLEVEVPHPAKLYKKSLKWKTKSQADQISLLTPPQTLEDFGITKALDITSQNASKAAAAYGANIQMYEQDTQYVTLEIPATTVQNTSSSQSQTLESIFIPDGLVANHLNCSGSFNYHTPTGTAYLEFMFSGHIIHIGDFDNRGTKTFDKTIELNPNIAGSISVVARYRRANNFSASVKVTCVSDPALFAEWQEETYLALESAYQKKYDEYSEALKLQQVEAAAEQNQADSASYGSEAANRLIEERELKRSCIEMLGRPYSYEMGKCFHNCRKYECENCEGETETVHIPEIVQNAELARYAEYVKFFETAFQWEILSYTFYPYYYNHKCAWYELMQTNCDDPIFEAFLQSGMAKVLVPVRPQFEKAVLWFLQTGEIYTEGDIVPETEEDQNLSLVYELQGQDEVTVEDTWETRVPSTLTIIQAKSTYLEDETGLPCSCALGESPFGSDNRVLEGLDNAEKQE